MSGALTDLNVPGIGKCEIVNPRLRYTESHVENLVLGKPSRNKTLISRYTEQGTLINLAFVPGGLSDICHNPVTNTMFGIRDQDGGGNEKIYEFEIDGTLIREIDLINFTDTEAIDYHHSEDDGHWFIVGEEQNNHRISLVKILDGDPVSVDRTSAGNHSWDTVYAGGTMDNRGLECIAYDSCRDRIYYTAEQKTDSTNNTPGTTHSYVWQLNPATGLSTILCDLMIDDVWNLVTDLSSMHFDRVTDSILLLSDESNAVVQIDRSTGALLTVRSIAGFTQPEGLAFTPDMGTMFVAGEDDEYNYFYLPWAVPANGGGVTTMTNIGAVPNADGATIAGVNLTLQPADASFGGVVTTAAQTIAGAKTVNALFSTNVPSVTPPGANTSFDQVNIKNEIAATSGNQQYSGALRFTGRGWKTAAVAASQAVDVRQYVIPIQGVSQPDASVNFDYAVNGGPFLNMVKIHYDSSNNVACFRSGNGTATLPTYAFLNATNIGMYTDLAGVLFTVGGLAMAITSSQIRSGPDGTQATPTWSFQNDGNTGLFRAAADVIAMSCGNFTVARFQYVTNTTTLAGIRLGTNAAPTAQIHFQAGDANAGHAPIKFVAGTNMATAETGAVEYNGTNLFFTRTGTTRETIPCISAVTTEVVVSDTTLTINYNGTTYRLLATA